MCILNVHAFTRMFNKPTDIHLVQVLHGYANTRMHDGLTKTR